VNTKIWWGIAVVFMGVIFYLSHQPAMNSNALSSQLTRVLLEVIPFVDPSTHSNQFNHLLRKSTHFLAYFGLAIIFWFVLPYSKDSVKKYSIAWLLATLYACTDELHQLFVDGRGGQLSDVLLDSSGAALAMACLFILHKKTRKHLSPSVSND